jgi:hypothetical protein
MDAGAIRLTEIPVEQCIHFEFHHVMVSQEALVEQMLSLEPAERERVKKARNEYLPSKPEGWTQVPKFGNRGAMRPGLYHEPLKLDF